MKQEQYNKANIIQARIVELECIIRVLESERNTFSQLCDDAHASFSQVVHLNDAETDDVKALIIRNRKQEIEFLRKEFAAL